MMVSEKEIKAEFSRKAQRDPEKHYPVQTLIEEGFERRRCKNCGNYFWSVEERDVCGEPDCSGGYTFIGDSPAREKMDFIETWQKFSSLFEGFGYTPIPRYPVVARWRDDADFVQASIYNFQPYCVSGEVDPPANPLVVPQFCLRFNDTDNVGITGRHYTGFVMIGQHAFMPPEKYDAVEYLRHIYLWLVEGMKLPREEIQFHEDAWAGGGNMGPCMEFFSRGLEIGNQVYMLYDIRSGVPKELDIKVLDMGMGQERPAWFTHGTDTSYEANFGPAVKKLYKATGVKPDEEILRGFLPYSGLLNIDDSEDIDSTWMDIAGRIDIDVEELKSQIVPLSGIYSIGDHARSLLLALSDGALPSNVGGGYNLRVLVRRALDFIYRYEWNIALPEVCEWHAHYLKPQYPELFDHLDEVAEILEVERQKYGETKRKSKRIVERLRGKEVSLDKLIELYDSNGISPEMLKEEGLSIDIPPDFYIQVSERHERIEQKAQTRRLKELELNGMPKTEIMYYDDYSLLNFRGRVLKVIDGRYVILDKTAFYPTSGGQLSDIGSMDGCKVIDVSKQGNVIIHRVETPSFREGDIISGKIDYDRRLQLTQHHTATHIINGVSKKILGEHIWQAGAEKTMEKSRLDVTHYASLNKEQLREIEEGANGVIRDNIEVVSKILRRDEAEAKFGFRLYQGGAVPGRELRVVKIGDLDVEACGGTHAHYTGEVGFVKVIGSTKIQDGVVRVEYVAGEAARKYILKNIFETSSRIITLITHLKETAPIKDTLTERLNMIAQLVQQFSSEEDLKRLIKKSGEFEKVLEFINALDDELTESAEVFSVPRRQLEVAFNRFVKEISDDREGLERLYRSLGEVPPPQATPLYDVDKIRSRPLPELSKMVFETWVKQKKEIERLKGELAKLRVEEIGGFEKVGKYQLMCKEIEAEMDDTIKMANEMLGADRIVVLFGINEKISVVGMRDEDIDIDMGEIVRDACKVLGGGGGGKPSFAQGAGVHKEKIDEAKEFVRRYVEEKVG
ncbi:MAG: alanine--tRNA ligase [Candidatus Hydrothermarchaeales archaeon]